MRRLKLLLSLILLFFLPLPSFAMRCGQDLVSPGETSAEVFQKCGTPYTQQRVGVEYEDPEGKSLIPQSEKAVEQWTYNQGPGSFLRILTFKGGILTAIEDGERIGSERNQPRRYLFTLGETSADVLIKYGEPMMRTYVGTESQETTDGLIEEKTECWTYNPGPGRFLQILTFRGGRLVKIETGERQ